MPLDPALLRLKRSTSGISQQLTRQERLDALQRRLDWLNSLLERGDYPPNRYSYMIAECEALTWAIGTLAGLVECHNLKWAIERELKLRAERQQDEAVQHRDL